MMSDTDGFIAQRYARLITNRDGALRRARSAARVTLPSLVPVEGHTSQTLYPTPYQSIGSRGVNNLAAKLLLALVPPNQPFFKLTISDADVRKMADDDGAMAKIEYVLGLMEQEAMKFIEMTPLRTKLFEALKHLMVAGNVLFYVDPKTAMPRTFPLSRYVTKRAPAGEIVEIIVQEDIYATDIPDEYHNLYRMNEDTDSSPFGDKCYKLYTRVYRKEPTIYEVHQELNGVEVPNSKATYAEGTNPWMALRWTAVENEDYGRGFVEEHQGDLNAFNRLSKALLDGAASASRVLWFLRPGAASNKRKIASAENGDILEGNAEDIQAIQLQKYADFRVAAEQATSIEQRLSMAFMMQSAIQRNGERVTAEEIRYMAGELDDALGGVYSVLSQELQLPLVGLLLKTMEKQGKLPVLPKNLVKPAITTGLEALGRGQDLQKLQLFVNALAPLGPETIAARLEVGDYITRVGTAVGINPQGLVKSEEKLAQEAQEAHQREMELQQAGMSQGQAPVQ